MLHSQQMYAIIHLTQTGTEGTLSFTVYSELTNSSDIAWIVTELRGKNRTVPTDRDGTQQLKVSRIRLRVRDFYYDSHC